MAEGDNLSRKMLREMAWKLLNVVEITQLAKTEQEIHIVVKVRASNTHWVLSSIYASPRLAERKLLWNNLFVVAPLYSLPWLMLGDFNELLSCQDKLGGNPLIPSRVLSFKECLDSCGMVDIGFHGPRFTWVNKREAGHYIQERLNRGFANIDWREIYPEAAVHHLACIHSDHCPVLLSLDNSPTSKFHRPFCFQSVWMSHPLFPKVVDDSWVIDRAFKANVDSFTNNVKVWNKEIFGNIFHRKHRVEARLRGIQNNIANGPNDFLLNLENQLRKEYFEILAQEEEFWSVKSRYNGLI
ncbi:uncharacterized protein LOC115951580 [Quercus lobata]|uniref:uncharacterized protein LOC115951580 n=1 Tax=Quercus lobata TaxID=97700 RepID=UPI0012440BA6|nr:uncharacterized protein LOC115951580 [Quercus lobata]